MGQQQERVSRQAGAGAQAGKRRPLYRSITDALREQLVAGNMAAGARMPALRELARRFSVSTITVRQALRMLEQEGHLHCLPGVGTFVRPILPRRVATDQLTIAFATIAIDGAFAGRLAHSIEEACQQRGWGMQLFNARGDPHIEARNLARLSESGANAAIILPVCDHENLEEMVKLKLADFPFVLVDLVVSGLKVDAVSSNHAGGAYLGTEYLLNHGHRRVLLATTQPTWSSVAARIRGYEQALIDHGLEPLREWKIWIEEGAPNTTPPGTPPWLWGYQAALPVLRKLELPVGVLAHNAYSGWGVFQACRELGLNVPNDVSIICFDDAEFTRALNPPMTALAQRTDEIGHRAVKELEHRISSGYTAEPQQILIDVDLVERGSVASIPPDAACLRAENLKS